MADAPTPAQLLAAQVATGLFIFVFMNWLGREVEAFGYQAPSLQATSEGNRTFNAVFRIASPIVVLTVVTAVLYWAKLDAWTIGIDRALYVSVGVRALWIVINGRTRLIPWGRVMAQWTTMLLLGSLIYREVLSHREILLPDPRSMAGELWLAVLGYAYILAGRKFTTDPGSQRRKETYIETRYRALRRRYESSVAKVAPEPHWRALTYSVILIEDFNRSWVDRFLERGLFHLGLAKSLGIMQVKADRPLTDEESIAKGVAILRQARARIPPRELPEDPATLEWREDEILHRMLVDYNPSGDYARAIEETYRLIAPKENAMMGAFLQSDSLSGVASHPGT